MKSRDIAILFIVVGGLCLGGLCLGGLYLGGRYIYYGSLTRNCTYTENRLPVPEELAKGEIVVAKDAYLAVGIERAHACLKTFGSIARKIVGPEYIDYATVGRHYFTDRGLTVESLKKGAAFRIVDVVVLTEHGISAFEGSIPIYYLVLKDKNNVSYQVSTSSLGLYKESVFLSFVDSSSSTNTASIELMSNDSFDTTYSGENSLKYTGKLIELTGAYLESTEPPWKKLADRLERGETFTMMVVIELRDFYGSEIELSDNPEERSRQVAQIQDEFIEKIPSNLIPKDLEKDRAWPYVYMEANLDLLNYLVDRRLRLKIESISELTRFP
jgi:hypothetical protein